MFLDYILDYLVLGLSNVSSYPTTAILFPSRFNSAILILSSSGMHEFSEIYIYEPLIFLDNDLS